VSGADRPRLQRRPATEADIPFLLALREQTMDAHVAASGIDIHAGDPGAARLERVRQRFDCAEILLLDGEPVGLIKVVKAPGCWKLQQIQLSPRLHGQGFGRTLVEALLADAEAAGVDVSLNVLRANPARRLYERLGFAQVGEDAHEFHMLRRHPGVDARGG
jgi:ribosomal protein S18 acetylase RimI-like enzyme